MTFFAADVVDAERCETRTRSLYVPLADGAFQVSEYAPRDRLADGPFFHVDAVESLYCSVAFTSWEGVWPAAPVTLIVLPALTAAGAEIDSLVEWHSYGVAPERAVTTTANTITAAVNTRATTVRLVNVFFMLPLRESASGAGFSRAAGREELLRRPGARASSPPAPQPPPGFETLEPQMELGVAECCVR